MSVFYLRARDSRPILEVALLDGDGSAHDLTGSTAWKLHIKLSTGTVLTKDMVTEGVLTGGLLRYVWVATDWDAGGLVVGTHRMEYEVIAGTSRLTFPSGGYDTLKIDSDLGQG